MFPHLPDGPVDRTGAQCGNFDNEFTARGNCCESLSPGFPQNRVDTALKAAEDCGHDVGVSARGGDACLTSHARSASPTAAAATWLCEGDSARGTAGDDARSPARRGRGLDIALDKTVAHPLVLRDRRGRLFVLDGHTNRVRRYFEGPCSVSGCRLTDARIHLELFARALCERRSTVLP